MLWVSNSFEITEMEFSPFCGKPLSSRIKKHLAEKLKPAASLFKCSAACFFSAVCGQIPHPDFVSVPLRRACGSSDDTIRRRYVRQMCVIRPSQRRHWLLRFNTNHNMEPNQKLRLCSDPKLSWMSDQSAWRTSKHFHWCGITLSICEAHVWHIWWFRVISWVSV